MSEPIVVINVLAPATEDPQLILAESTDLLRVNGIQVTPMSGEPFLMEFVLPEDNEFLSPPLLWGTAPDAFGGGVAVSRNGTSFTLEFAPATSRQTFSLFLSYKEGDTSIHLWRPIEIVNNPPASPPESLPARPLVADIRLTNPGEEPPVLEVAYASEEGWIGIAGLSVVVTPFSANDSVILTFSLAQGSGPVGGVWPYSYLFPACLWEQAPPTFLPPVVIDADRQQCQVSHFPGFNLFPVHNIVYFHFLDPQGGQRLVDPVITDNPPNYGGGPGGTV